MRIPLANFNSSSAPEGTLRWSNFVDIYLPFQVVIWSFYVYVVGVLFASKKSYFKSGFFLLFKYTAVSDVLVAAATVVYSLNFRIGFNPRWNYLIALCSTMSGGSYMIHLVGGLSMTFCQLTAVLIPWRHTLIWTPRFVKLLFSIIVVICYAPFMSVLIFGVDFEYDTDSDSWYYTRRKGYFPYMNLIASISITTYEIVNLIAGITVIITLRRTKEYEQTRKNLKETTLVLFSLINVAFAVVDFLFETEAFNYFTSQNSGFTLWFQNQFTFYFFLLMTINGVSILFISKATREELVRIWSKQQALTVQADSSKHRASSKL